MHNLFLTVLNMSLMGSFVIVAVILLRFCLKKAPKTFSYALWLIVWLRLISPFSFKSIIGISPIHADTISQDIIYQQVPRIQSGVSAIDNLVNQVLPQATPQNSMNPLQAVVALGGTVWLLGMAVLLLYSLFSIYRLNGRLKSAVHVKNNIYQAEKFKTPFVLGVRNPRIFLPANLSEEETTYILMHEQTHIRRQDPLIKMITFFVLGMHWFNPLVWVPFCS